MSIIEQNTSNRRLAAILFADIVGYTAMMQSDEGQAMSRLQRYQDVLRSEVTHHKGELIKNYGDGSLCLFNSVLDAVNCAKTIQKKLQEEPKVPLRIGVHLGDVMYRDDDIYGNAVNVSSRIESMGVPGSVMMSKNVYDKVKNQSAFSFESYGSFEFKNVDEPMEVFALANEGLIVPKREEMKGKLKTLANSKKKWILPAVMGLILIAVLGIWQFSTKDSKGGLDLSQENFTPTNTPLPKTYTEQRVAILPIKNNTNDADLDIFGTMASDWITRGLMEIEGAEVVSPNTVIQNLDAIGILPNNLKKELSFNELTGAENYIQGNFYNEGEELIFLVQLVDAIGGKILYNFPEIRGDENQRENLITKLREKITGYWAAQDLVSQNKIKVPDYEAYKLYIELTSSRDNLDKTIEDILTLDSTFYLARLRYLNDERHQSGQKKHFDFLERHKSELSQYEKSWYDYLRAYYLGQPIKAFNTLNDLRKKYPKDFSVNHECAGLAHEGLNNPQLSQDIYNELKTEGLNITQTDVLYNYRIYHEMLNLYKIGDLKALEHYYNTVQPNEEVNFGVYQTAKLYGAALLKKENDVEKIMNSRGFAGAAMTGYSSIWTENQRIKLLAGGLEAYMDWDGGESYKYALEVWKGQNPIIDFEELKKYKVFTQIRNLRWSAIGLIDNEKMDQIPKIISALEDFSEPNLNTSAQFESAFSNYVLGVIYTKMGDIDKGLHYLKISRNLGYRTMAFNFEFDIILEPLYDMPEFKELIQPIWPEIKG